MRHIPRLPPNRGYVCHPRCAFGTGHGPRRRTWCRQRETWDPLPRFPRPNPGFSTAPRITRRASFGVLSPPPPPPEGPPPSYPRRSERQGDAAWSCTLCRFELLLGRRPALQADEGNTGSTWERGFGIRLVSYHLRCGFSNSWAWVLSNCSGSSWRSGAQEPLVMCSPHTQGAFFCI